MISRFSSGLQSWRPLLACGGLLLLAHLGYAAPATSVRPKQLDNWFAYIPPSCYVETVGKAGKIHNSCYVCHQKGRPPNFIDGSDLQLEYSFAAPARKNPWSNLLKDRTASLRNISDEEIIPARPKFLSPSHQRATVLAGKQHTVSTVEHLLAALWAFGENNARILIEGPEIPILDGSALPFAKALEEMGGVEVKK